jgi:dUTP pyrophosphatase
MKLKFYKIRENAKLPHRAHPTDAGADLFYCPDLTQNSQRVWTPGRKFKIPPGENCLVPTGLKVNLPPHYMLEIKNKSSVAAKRQLLIGACVVDPGYTGEILVNLHNIGRETQEIAPGQKIAQAVLVPIEVCDVAETFVDPENKKTLRGSGGFGSTGGY